MAKRILLVDDELYIRDLYEELLKGEGYEVTTAADGEEALSHAVEGGYDLILLDVVMPKKDGITFLKDYKAAHPKHPNGKIVMLSVLADDPVIETAKAQGAIGFLIKSNLNPDEVVAEVKKYLA